MSYIKIHDSGHGGEKLEIHSWWNGGAYAAHLGEAGSPMRTLWFQGEDAAIVRDTVDADETANPDKLTRDVWLDALDAYL